MDYRIRGRRSDRRSGVTVDQLEMWEQGDATGEMFNGERDKWVEGQGRR